ncbi:MAG: PrsW family intramembrane metalloprotease [Anaerolineales bacterium]|nr:PrsW family intramembrane metalloprotease [Chloroflexota bacterium]MBL6982521.1 PrsW family intramembrane metalloprotease [Anaerolineales bacterium]
MGFALSVFFGFAPMLFFAWILNWLDRYEKEPKVLLGLVFIWGAVVAAGLAFVVNTLLGMGVYFLTESDAITEFATGSLVAPPVEESLKGLAVLLVFLIVRKEFDSVLDGIVYAGVAALGFAATENVYYIYNYGFLEDGMEGLFMLVFVRVILVGWQHPFYTAFIGIGLATTRLNKNPWVKLLAPIIGWMMAIFAHSIHNTIATVLTGLPGLAVGMLFDWGGWFLMLLLVLWAIRRIQLRIKKYLRDEVDLGVISSAQYKTAASAWSQSFARLSAFFSGKFRDTRNFYQLCSELAHKKYQLDYFGDEKGNQKFIDETRQKLIGLAPKVSAW